jgi:hypothetical protein
MMAIASGVPCQLDVVVRGIALIVMNREGLHFTGLLEDTCPDVVDVKLLFVRFLEGVLGLKSRKRGSCTRRTQATDKPTNSFKFYVDSIGLSVPRTLIVLPMCNAIIAT